MRRLPRRQPRQRARTGSDHVLLRPRHWLVHRARRRAAAALPALRDHLLRLRQQFPRGPVASRFYLECAPDDVLDDWTDERIWTQLRLRLGDEGLPTGTITEKAVVEMRSFVSDPMRYGRLFLVGDAAHIITPMGGKGMNLAIADANVLAHALRAAVHDGDDEQLAAYSATCLKRVWNHQEFSRWMTEMTHEAGDDTLAGSFRRQLARARLDRLFTSDLAARAFADMMAGGDAHDK
ncbi:FAD-dependent monooxygenase [Nonomuraea sp. M3C6]|uniref:FAD-dependent monooxygenase n=1 Tax=Nonomuraea marmarensis TaxID=3351344 RepID=A0ABW7ARY9_9ACTN